jgi:hypothetical protein
MSAEILYSEILEEFQNAKGKNEKIAVLRKHDHPRLRDFFYCLFNKTIKFDVIVPEYRDAIEPAGLNYTYLDIEMPKLYRFIVGHPKRTNVEPKKLSNLLKSVLESLHKDEAKLLVGLIKKDLGVKHLTPLLVKEAYPNLDI